jgi:hypothetical protein
VVRGSVNSEKSPTARIRPVTRTQKGNAAFSAGEQDMTKRTAENHGQSMAAEVGGLCCLEASYLPEGNNKTILHGASASPNLSCIRDGLSFQGHEPTWCRISQLNRLERNATMK